MAFISLLELKRRNSILRDLLEQEREIKRELLEALKDCYEHAKSDREIEEANCRNASCEISREEKLKHLIEKAEGRG